MMRCAEFIARLKAWQVFVALVAPMLSAQMYMVNVLPVPQPGQPPDMAKMAQHLTHMMVVSALMCAMFLSWLVSVGCVANARIDVSIRPPVRWYLSAAVYAPSYAAIAGSFFSRFFETGANLPVVIIVMHVAAMVAIFYVLGFSAKNLIMAERSTPVSFFDYSGPFFLMWLFPFGIWFVQPRVNRLVAQT
jgi:hypothetical protein